MFASASVPVLLVVGRPPSGVDVVEVLDPGFRASYHRNVSVHSGYVVASFPGQPDKATRPYRPRGGGRLAEVTVASNPTVVVRDIHAVATGTVVH